MKEETSRPTYFIVVGTFFILFFSTQSAHAAVSVSVYPASTSTLANGTTTFIATVVNASNTSITWSAAQGIISPSGIYTAPSFLGTSTLTDTVTATSIQDNTKSATATVTVSSGLAAYWPLDEGMGTTAYDLSGNGNNGTWSGAASGTAGYYSGNSGSYAGAFDGSTTQVNLGAASISPTSTITLSAWVDQTSVGPTAGLFIVGNPAATLYVNGGSANYNAHLNIGGTDYFPGTATTLNAWHLLTTTYDGSSIVTFLDGNRLSSTAAAGTIFNPGGNETIGGNPFYSNFPGLIDDVRIYNRALSNSEVAALYISGRSVPSAPTGVSAVAGDNAAVVTFGSPLSNGGSGITLYTITASPGNVVATTTMATSTIISGLTNGVSYTFTVTATNNVGISASSPSSNSVIPVVGSVMVNWTSVDQVIDGFGASDAFTYPPLTSSQADLFFSTTNGVGLSLLRTMIPDDGSCSTVNGTCAGSVSDMQMAIARGARVWSTPWAPPASMTTNGSVDCTTSPSPSHLASSSYASYATYLSNYISSTEAQGIPLYALSVQNEPDICEGYDSAIWSDQNIHDFVLNNLGPTLAAHNQTSTKIILPESGDWADFTGLADTTMNDPAASTYVGVLAFHGYDNSFSVSNPYASSGKSFWETEVSGEFTGGASSPLAANFGNWDPSMADALLWAQVMNYNLTGANENAWNYWWLVNQNNDNEGLTLPNGSVSKRLYMMGNYSKFVRPGWHRIDATINPTAGIYLSAYKDSTNSNFAIVVINTNASGTPITLNLNSFPAVSSVTPWVTSANLNLSAQTSLSVSGNSFTPTLAAQSVTTFVGIEAPPPPVTVGVAAGYAIPTVTSASFPITTPTTASFSNVSTSSLLAQLTSPESELILLHSQAGESDSSFSSAYVFMRNLSYGTRGNDVRQLQEFLISEASGPAAQKLKTHGATQTFATLTYNALVEFQIKAGISPSSGYFGPITKAWVNRKE
jgi:glucuronoarabinoxylan endo-1,4-beta-xylanase